MALASAWRRATVYAVVDGHGRRHWRWTLKPLVDAAYWRKTGARLFVPLSPPLPAMWAELACRTAARLETAAEADGAARPPGLERLLGRLPWFAHFMPSDTPQTRYTRPLENRLSLGKRPAAEPDCNAQHALDAVAGIVRRVERALRWAGWNGGVSPGEPLPLCGEEEAREFTAPPAEDVAAVADALRGRLLSLREAETFIEQQGLALSRPAAECLTWLAASGQLRQWPGIRRNALGMMQCVRCGETEKLHAWECAACGSPQCWQCEACRSMGAVRSCTVLYAAAAESNVPAAEPRAVTIRSPQLTPAQRRAADALYRFVASHLEQAAGERRGSFAGASGKAEPRDAVVWAVCGAGKTEMAFAAVGKVLEQGGRVLFAIPRRDVVRQLGERLREAFPGAELQVLHGGLDRIVVPMLSPGSLTVATTHQVLRYYRAFDLVVLDEVDAFPYRGSRMLAEAVVRATAPGGLRIRMTATPDRELLRRAEAGECVLVRVPARYHGYPLPVPELVVDRRLGDLERGAVHGKPFRPSPTLLSLIERSLSATPPARVLLFVPTILAAERVGKSLAEAMPGDVLWSHAQDPERDGKLAAFLRGEGRVFVATSILERGVTVPDVDVIVLYADAERIFQEPALIQMAGRVGRTMERPTGRVAFVGRRITAAMRAAVRHIQSMNEEAAALGLLRVPLGQAGGESPTANVNGAQGARDTGLDGQPDPAAVAAGRVDVR